MERKSTAEVTSVGSLAKAAEAAGFAMAPAEEPGLETPRVVWDGIRGRHDSRHTRISFASLLAPRLALTVSWWKSLFGGFSRHAPA